VERGGDPGGYCEVVQGQGFLLELVHPYLSTTKSHGRSRAKETPHEPHCAFQEQRLLRVAYRLMGTDADDLEPYKLTKEQKASVDRSKNDVKAGRTLTERRANKAVDKWLGK